MLARASSFYSLVHILTKVCFFHPVPNKARAFAANGMQTEMQTTLLPSKNP
jgi:hypothetical protein